MSKGRIEGEITPGTFKGITATAAMALLRIAVALERIAKAMEKEQDD